jgi:hypothetical protein
LSRGTKKPTALVYVFDDVDLSGVTGDALYVTVACESSTDCPIDTALAKSDTDFGACQPVAPLRPSTTASTDTSAIVGLDSPPIADVADSSPILVEFDAEGFDTAD